MTAKSLEAGLSLIENDKSKILGLTIGQHQITPGQVIPKADAKNPPQISLSEPTGNYIVICLDPDAPFPSFSFLGPIMHWVQPGLKASSETTATGQTILTSETSVIINYGPPGPPPGSSPHRYIFLLYEQPEGFQATDHAPEGGKTLKISQRVKYNLSSLEKQMKLGPVVAANYFCSN
ncbi:hypothetical protein ASPWEDRAFT_167086 [Aspergillus wentii DTO 134E9]|uniref:Uncharacterized protein n=1 Tax=Aspergillus wentii DTO 134E9 TaxID=1073089 RepID=A0A1L9S1K5_ASPWE|nr:uncharacterized protein ASPWEDRAFT_167086 [Aspergillus wentii DTO 134E9]KAI9930960.1 hypothetical protein MW887_010615 [Aspergillus wentii]OJJ41048.1 hypothetical protein ASPWEDRAFT_167086 [Aspergillus wentii DTO 134E9]